MLTEERKVMFAPLPEPEEAKAQMNEFFKIVRGTADPYFSQKGYTAKIYKGRGIVAYEKHIDYYYVLVHFASFAKCGFRRFRVACNGYNVNPNPDNPNISWEYMDQEELKDRIKQILDIIDTQDLIPIWEQQTLEFVKRERITKDKSVVPPDSLTGEGMSCVLALAVVL